MGILASQEKILIGLHSEITRLRTENKRLRAALDLPEINDFLNGVRREAAHQRERWGTAHDEGKEPHDWFWLIGYLAGKALRAAQDGDLEKLKHHCISSAAALANWHAFASGDFTAMRPGVRLREDEPT